MPRIDLTDSELADLESALNEAMTKLENNLRDGDFDDVDVPDMQAYHARLEALAPKLVPTKE